MPNFLTEQILSLIIRQPALAIHFELLPKIVNIRNLITGKPLPRNTMLNQDQLPGDNLGFFAIEAKFGVEVLDWP